MIRNNKAFTLACLVVAGLLYRRKTHLPAMILARSSITLRRTITFIGSIAG